MKKSLLLSATILGTVSLSSLSSPKAASSNFPSENLINGVISSAIKMNVPKHVMGLAQKGIKDIRNAINGGEINLNDSAKIAHNYIMDLGRSLDIKKNFRPAVGAIFSCINQSTMNHSEVEAMHMWTNHVMLTLVDKVYADLNKGQLDSLLKSQSYHRYSQDLESLFGLEKDSIKMTPPEIFSPETMKSFLHSGYNFMKAAYNQGDIDKDSLDKAVELMKLNKMKKMKSTIVSALLKEADHLIQRELSDGKVNDMDKEGKKINWMFEVKESSERAVKKALENVIVG